MMKHFGAEAHNITNSGGQKYMNKNVRKIGSSFGCQTPDPLIHHLLCKIIEPLLVSNYGN